MRFPQEPHRIAIVVAQQICEKLSWVGTLNPVPDQLRRGVPSRLFDRPSPKNCQFRLARRGRHLTRMFGPSFIFNVSPENRACRIVSGNFEKFPSFVRAWLLKESVGTFNHDHVSLLTTSAQRQKGNPLVSAGQGVRAAESLKRSS